MLVASYCKYFFISRIVLTCTVWGLITNCTKALEFLFSDNHLTVMCRPIWKMKYFLALHSRSFFPKSAFYSVTCAWLVIQTQFQHDRSDVSFTACIAYQKIERYFAEIMLNIVLNIYIILHHLESSRFTFTVLALS